MKLQINFRKSAVIIALSFIVGICAIVSVTVRIIVTGLTDKIFAP